MEDLDGYVVRRPQPKTAPNATEKLINASRSRKYIVSGSYSCLCMQEDLYDEDVAVKAAATARIASLFQHVKHLTALLEHPSLLPLLARSLREDGRWSPDLSTHILSAFFALSQFSQLHAKLLELRISSLAMDTLELALRRLDHQEVSMQPLDTLRV